MYIVQFGLFGQHRISVRAVINLYPLGSIMLKLGEKKPSMVIITSEGPLTMVQNMTFLLQFVRGEVLILCSY